MAASNPVSPKAIWAGIGSILGPFLLEFVALLVDLVNSGDVAIPAPWDKVALVAASVIGALVASYVKTDPLRIPTVDQAAVDQLADER